MIHADPQELIKFQSNLHQIPFKDSAKFSHITFHHNQDKSTNTLTNDKKRHTREREEICICR
jgi:uncharacterized protein (DUF2235 family)